MAQDADELDGGPNISSERRLKSPVRTPATKRKKNIHVEEPSTKRSIVVELSDDMTKTCASLAEQCSGTAFMRSIRMIRSISPSAGRQSREARTSS